MTALRSFGLLVRAQRVVRVHAAPGCDRDNASAGTAVPAHSSVELIVVGRPGAR